MTSAPEKIAQACWRLVPARLENKLRTEAGIRFTRFILVALTAVVTSQVVLGLLTGPVNWSAGASGVIASMVAALVSYVLSRWAWERKGRPDLLKETLPFWAISLCVGVVLTGTSKLAHAEAHALGLHRLEEVVFAQGLYLAANCVTFVIRFLIFHYVLFADRGSGDSAEPADRVSAPEGPVPAAVTPSANRPAGPAAGAPAERPAPRTRR